MKKLALLALVGAALVVTTGAASAQYYDSPGFAVYIGPRYDRDYYSYRYYDDSPRYYRRYRYYDDSPRYYRRDRYSGYEGRRYYRGGGGGGGCPYGYTVQDGVCKPYRGY